MPDTNQKGQAAVFVLLLLGVVCISWIFLYKAGSLTSEKIQLQNAADAAAYSVSTLEARAYNFSSYTNRAMVANEVAIGQMVGIISWVDHLASSGSYLAKYAALTGPAAPFIISAGEFIQAAGTAINKVLQAIASPTISVISAINQGYSLAQEAYHGATIILVASTIMQTLEDNVPGTVTMDGTKLFVSGAKLSDFGMIALAGHLQSYYKGYTRRFSSSKDTDAMQRMAGTISDSRDDFSKGRKLGGDLPGMPMNIGLDQNIVVGIKSVASLEIDFSLPIVIDLSFEGKGGTELRYKGKSTGDAFSWSAADTLGLEGSVDITPPKVRGCVTILGIKYCESFDSKDFGTPDIHLQAGAPFGSGASQAAGSTGIMTSLDMVSPGSVASNDYGGAPGSPPQGRNLAWNDVTNFPYGVMNIQTKKVPAQYKGLQSYRDVDTANNPKYGFQAPNFIIGIVKEISEVNEKGPQFAGRLTLVDAAPDGEIAAIAKSEVYFKRPADLSYFTRNDGKTETANIFSPFWQARLAKTQDEERFLALLAQQKVLWISGEALNDVPLGNKAAEVIKDILNFLL